jgi:tetratricopeptide (TPR) repeat protein
MVAPHVIAAMLASPDTVLDPATVFARASRSVVVVEVFSDKGVRVSQGSGVAIRRDAVITNVHVLEQGVSARVRRGEESWSAVLSSWDGDRDLALLRVTEATFESVAVRKMDSLVVGEPVYAIGAPRGLDLSLSGGLVSGIRKLPSGDSLIQTTAAISPGSSGGGLFDAQARLVGITTLKLSDSEGLNFAVPAELIQALPESGGTGMVNLATRYPDSDPEKWLSVGRMASLGRDYAVAFRAFRKAAKLRPRDPDPWTQIGGLELERKRWSAALDAFAQATRIDGQNAQALVGRAVAEAMVGRRQEAARTLAEVTRLHSRSREAWVFVAGAWKEIGDQDRAIEAYERARQLPYGGPLEPGFSDAQIAVWTAAAHKSAGRDSKAAAAFEEATRLDPSNREAWVGLANTAVRMRQYARAVPAYETALRLFEDAAIWVQLGNARALGGDSLGAIRAFREAARLDSANADAWFFLGVELAAIGQYSDAVAALRHLRDVDPRRAAELEDLLSRVPR